MLVALFTSPSRAAASSACWVVSGPISPCSGMMENYFSVGNVVAVTQGDLEASSHQAMEQLKGREGLRVDTVVEDCVLTLPKG